MSHGVADFFGVAETKQKQDPTLEKWHARSRLLHSNSVLLSRRAAWASSGGRARRVKSPLGGARDENVFEMATPLADSRGGDLFDVGGAWTRRMGIRAWGGRAWGVGVGAGGWGKRGATAHPFDPLALRHQRLGSVCG